MMEDANEIQEALSRSYGTPDIDEDDLEAGQADTRVFCDLLNITQGLSTNQLCTGGSVCIFPSR